MRVRVNSSEGDSELRLTGVVGVVLNYFKDPVIKDEYQKPMFLDINWGQPAYEWSHNSLDGLVIHEH